MRVALIKSNTVADEIVPPFGLGYLAESARREGHDVIVVDALRDRMDAAALVRKLSGWRPGFVGVLLFTKDLRPVRDLLRAVRGALPEARTCVGGPHPSAVPRETLEYFGGCLDFGFAGEAESGLASLLRVTGDGREGGLDGVPGLAYREGEEVRTNERRFEEDLDRLSVAWDLIPPDVYPRSPHGAYYRRFPVAPIVTSRGCPHQCTFCASACVSGRKIRRRSVEGVIEEIGVLHRRHGVREIHIEDDNFTGDKEYVLAFCDRMRSAFPDVSWTCPNGVRVDTLDREMLDAMKSSGMYFLSVGIESGSNRILRLMKKSLTVERMEDKIRLIHEAGIGISGFFMLGFPGETREEMEETIRFAARLPLDRASFANFQPFPGCEEFDRLRRSGEFTVDWDLFAPTLQSTTYAPSGVDVRTLRRLRKRALWTFYARPAIVWKMLGEVRSPGHALHVLRRGWRWLTIPG